MLLKHITLFLAFACIPLGHVRHMGATDRDAFHAALTGRVKPQHAQCYLHIEVVNKSERNPLAFIIHLVTRDVRSSSFFVLKELQVTLITFRCSKCSKLLIPLRNSIKTPCLAVIAESHSIGHFGGHFISSSSSKPPCGKE